MKKTIKKILSKLGLLYYLFKLNEYLIAFKNRKIQRKNFPEDFPIPPSYLRVLVVHHQDPNTYYEIGRSHAFKIKNILEKNDL